MLSILFFILSIAISNTVIAFLVSARSLAHSRAQRSHDTSNTQVCELQKMSWNTKSWNPEKGSPEIGEPVGRGSHCM